MSDVFICPDCEQPLAMAPDSLCSVCAQWRKEKLGEMDSEWLAAQARQERRRMSPEQRFAEDLADMVKALERSRQ